MITPADWSPALVEAFRPAVDVSPWGPLAGPMNVLPGSHLFEYRHGAQHALIAAKPLALDNGQRVDVVGVVSLGDRMHCARLIDEFRAVARDAGADLVTMATRHEHLQRAADRAGWTRGGVVMYGWVNRRV